MFSNRNLRKRLDHDIYGEEKDKHLISKLISDAKVKSTQDEPY